MKKLLALVLALVMTLGLATVGTNAAFTDKDAVAASDYSTAIQVLNGMKVFNGYPDGSFKPANDITRAEVAAMIYRLYTGDVNDTQAKIYANDKFSDVKANDWYAGYVGYCENSNFIYGYGGKFYPNDKVTGYQALAMVLRAVGYNKENDFTGNDWKTWTANYAQQRGLVTNVSSQVLEAPANRALVAEILFEAAQIATVTHTPALGYNMYVNSGLLQNNLTPNASLGWKNFHLTYDGTGRADDAWGRPVNAWYGEYVATAAGNAALTEAAAKAGAYAYGDTIYDVTYAEIAIAPTATYYNAVTECDIAHDTKATGNTTYEVYINSNAKANYVVQPTDTVTKLGAPGRITEVYYHYTTGVNNPVANNRIVMIDTYLARVIAVRDAAYDANGHRNVDAMITLDVYTGQGTGLATTLAGAGGNVRRVTRTQGGTNYTYSAGDFVLLQAATDGTEAAVVAANTTGVITNRVGSAANFATLAMTAATPSVIVGKPTELTGAQTVIHYFDGKHTVEGTEYNDAIELHLDMAGNDITKHTWLFDTKADGSQYLIGVVDIATVYSYGVIDSMWWAGDPTTGAGSAMATVRYMDGTTGTVTLASVAIDQGNNANTNNTFGIPTYDVSGGAGTATMTIAQRDGATAATTNTNGFLHVATHAATNLNSAGNIANGIIRGNLFRFETLANGAVAAVEVDTLNVADAAGTMNKAAGQTITRGVSTNGAVLVDGNTVFLIRNPATGAYTSVTGYTNLPAAGYVAAEVDYVNADADVFAEFVYINAAASTAFSSNLFYLTTTAYTWVMNATNTAIDHYVLTGILDGTPATINVPVALTGQTAAPALVNAGNTAATGLADIVTPIIDAGVGKLWVVSMINGNVENIQDFDNTITNAVTLTGAPATTYTSGTAVVTAGSAANAATGNRYVENAVALNLMRPANATYATSSAITTAGNLVTYDASGNATTYRSAAGANYNITGVTPLVGAWQADMTGKTVVLVYATATNIVSQAYVYDTLLNAAAINSTSTDSVGGAAVTGTGALNATALTTVAIGATPTLTVTVNNASAYDTITYAWTKGGVPIVGATAATYTLSAATDTGAAGGPTNYVCTITATDNSKTGVKTVTQTVTFPVTVVASVGPIVGSITVAELGTLAAAKKTEVLGAAAGTVVLYTGATAPTTAEMTAYNGGTAIASPLTVDVTEDQDDITLSNNLYVPAGTTVEITGTKTFANVYVEGTLKVMGGGNLTVTDKLVVTTTGHLQTYSSGTITAAAAKTYNAGTASIVFGGTGAKTLGTVANGGRLAITGTGTTAIGVVTNYNSGSVEIGDGTSATSGVTIDTITADASATTDKVVINNATVALTNASTASNVEIKDGADVDTNTLTATKTLSLEGDTSEAMTQVKAADTTTVSADAANDDTEVTVEVAADAKTLTVEEGTTQTITLESARELETLIVNGTLEVKGSFALTVSKALTVGAAGKITVAKDLTFGVNTTVSVADGGKVIVGDTLTTEKAEQLFALAQQITPTVGAIADYATIAATNTTAHKLEAKKLVDHSALGMSVDSPANMRTLVWWDWTAFATTVDSDSAKWGFSTSAYNTSTAVSAANKNVNTGVEVEGYGDCCLFAVSGNAATSGVNLVYTNDGSTALKAAKLTFTGFEWDATFTAN